MRIQDLLQRFRYNVEFGDKDVEVSGVSRDNRQAKAGDLFICTKGVYFDTHDPQVITDLVQKGIHVFVVEKPIPKLSGMTIIRVEDTRAAGALIYTAYYGNPAESMTVIGITGSKGKTTTTHMLAAILTSAGHKVGTIGSIGVTWNDQLIPIMNTTPESCDIQRFLRSMADDGCDTVIMEVSSTGMKQHRVGGICFDYGLWMNLQKGDHISPIEHNSFEDYGQCKAQVLLNSRQGFVPENDPLLEPFIKDFSESLERFGSSENADYRATDIRETFDEATGYPGIAFKVQGKSCFEIKVNKSGLFNVWNALAAIAVADHMGVDSKAMKEALEHLRIPGREEIVYHGSDFTVCVDFAHNGASLKNHLQAVRAYRPKRLVCIFGADGNRSLDRRFLMGEAAATYADFSVVTSGHNRSESFEAILESIKVGLNKVDHPNYLVIKDRKTAIRYAIDHAQPGDFITIVGLGNETWQEENGKKIQHSDKAFVEQVLKEKDY